MKNFYISLFIIFLGSVTAIQSQEKKTDISGNLLSEKSSAGISYSVGSADLFANSGIIGGPTYIGRGFNRIGLWLIRDLGRKTDIHFTASYTDNRFNINAPYTGTPVVSRPGSVKHYAVSVFARYHFFKYLYAGAGPVFGISSGERDISGIGAGGNFGAEYAFSNGIVISFGPYGAIHGLLPAKTYKLINAGVSFSIGYKL